MKRVLILGATGMLGNALYKVLKDKYKLVLSVRDPQKVELLEKMHGGTQAHEVIEFHAAKIYDDFLNKKGHPGIYLSDFLNRLGDIDYVINAIGVTIPFAMENPALTFFINGALPHVLAQTFGDKLIHITTDCVYNGLDGYPYDENSSKTPVDIYGLSKSLGEPTTCLTLRTSIIGRELEGFTGLLEWFLQQDGKEIGGFSNHYWNGLTTIQFAKLCDEIMEHRERYPRAGIYHVFSTSVSKYDMLKKIKDKYGSSTIIKENPDAHLNRTLTTQHDLVTVLHIPSFDQMIDEL
ncbi:MAG: sugar nucleotide-binding protein [Candidatus Yanofskybacteria bacterium]|nr:sugar nucleotide-binding protein [Candidatus Yanofskybacteria bacterium]